MRSESKALNIAYVTDQAPVHLSDITKRLSRHHRASTHPLIHSDRIFQLWWREISDIFHFWIPHTYYERSFCAV